MFEHSGIIMSGVINICLFHASTAKFYLITEACLKLCQRERCRAVPMKMIGYTVMMDIMQLTIGQITPLNHVIVQPRR